MQQDFGKGFFIAITLAMLAIFCFSLRMENEFKNKVSFENETSIKLQPKTIKLVDHLEFQIPQKEGLAKGACLEDDLYDLYFFETNDEDVVVILKILHNDHFASEVLSATGAVREDVQKYYDMAPKFEDLAFPVSFGIPNAFGGVTYNAFCSTKDTIEIINDNYFYVSNDAEKILIKSSRLYPSFTCESEHIGAIIVWDKKKNEILFLGKFNFPPV